MSKIKLYKDNPTAGMADGALASSGTGLSPVSSGTIRVPESGYQEGSWVKLALRCDAGFETVEDESRHARVSIEDSDHVDKWQLAHDDSGSPDTPEDWGDPLDFNTQISDTNVIFWARARAAHTEDPANDNTVQLKVDALIGAQ